jgi:hypothetical protein
MLEQHTGRKAQHEFAGSSASQTDPSKFNDPEQGARLIRAFLRITDPRVRLAIVDMIEGIGSARVDC